MRTDLIEAMAGFAGAMRKHADALGSMASVEWRESGAPVEYPHALALMEERVAAIRAGEARELVWLLEHPALYSAGSSAAPGDLLTPHRFPVYQAGRGGQYTYHGPGQIVAYVMLDLDRRGRDVRCFVHRLEDWVMAALGEFGVRGERRAGRPGIWVSRGGDAGDAKAQPSADKIAAIGVRVRRWVTYHGVAVNIAPDLEHFSGIVPCGITDAGVTSLAALAAQGRAKIQPALAGA
jgi:lipoyl(octanoyl) transferase